MQQINSEILLLELGFVMIVGFLSLAFSKMSGPLEFSVISFEVFFSYPQALQVSENAVNTP